ncbi:NAD(P)H-dependent FMN reductase [Sphingomonas sp. PP-CE-1A-559]|uniref:NADPH-dependent FMN reductase n=1 Tax=Sphingomonas sp. PP-CE-1A-559 TaxID=2135657 RepID=UPI0010557941|nr:NAD(P)H-dependent oxidoreductase [Sphingomonas sp. PP-CE-1A-559]TCP86351.1 NAD(P)H-dependent FMN reductase [Sphingomonas sp. PP-CE-1A-559]
MPAGSRIALLALSGSAHSGSRNARLLDLAIDAAITVEADVSVLDLRDLELPVYVPGLEEAVVPQGVLVIRQILCAHDGLLICSPGYNGSVSVVLKNALEWGSQPTFGTGSLAPFRNKIAAIMSVSEDVESGAIALQHLRTILQRMGVIVMPDALAFADDAFAADALRDASVVPRVQRQVRLLIDALRAQQHGTVRTRPLR